MTSPVASFFSQLQKSIFLNQVFPSTFDIENVKIADLAKITLSGFHL
jgi:hypothetical protein